MRSISRFYRYLSATCRKMSPKNHVNNAENFECAREYRKGKPIIDLTPPAPKSPHKKKKQITKTTPNSGNNNGVNVNVKIAN